MKNDKLYHIITLGTIIIIGIGLYFVLQNGFSKTTAEKQSESATSTNIDYKRHNLKIIKYNYKNFATKSIDRQDDILYHTKQNTVRQKETAQKKKITDAMETTLDKKIIGEISSLQNDAHPFDKADDLNHKIQNLKSLTPQAKAQFGQEIQGVKQNIQSVR